MKNFGMMLLAFVCSAAMVSAGENLLKNGDFKQQSKSGQISHWGLPGKLPVKYFAKGAPNGGYIRVTHDASQANITFRQYSKSMKPQTDYKISLYVRGSKDFAAKRFYLLFINEGWTKNTAIRDIKITPEWQKIERILKTTDFKKSSALVFNIITTAGWVDIADVKVEAIAQK